MGSITFTPSIGRYLFVITLIALSLYLLAESWLLPLALGILTLFLFLIVKYPKAGILLMYLTKPILDATYFFKFPFIGLNFLQITGVMFPIFTILILGSLRTKISEYRDWRIILLLTFSSVLSFVVYLISHLHLGGSRLIEMLVSSLVILFQFLNGISAYFLIPKLFNHEKDKKLFLQILIWATLFPLITAYLQIAGIIEGRTLRTTGQLIRISGLYHDSTNLRFYSFQAIGVIIIYLSIYRNQIQYLTRLILFLLIFLFVFVIYLGYSKAAVAILFAWGLAYILITRNILLGGTIVMGMIFSYLTIPRISDEIDKLFYKEIMYYEGTLSEELEYTLLGGRFVRWERYLNVFEQSDLIYQLLGIRYTIGILSHNDFLRVAYSYGIIGFIFYIVFLFNILRRVLHQFFIYRDGLAFGAVLFFIAFIIDSIGLTPSIYTGYSWVVFGIISLSINRHIESNPKTFET